MEFRITTIELEEIDNATLQKGQGEIKKIKINGACPYDDFTEQLDETDVGNLSAIFGRMAFQCNNDVELSRKLCEKIKIGRHCIGFAYKEKGLMLYCLRTEKGFIIYNGGQEKTKEEDRKRFIRIVLGKNGQAENANTITNNSNHKISNHYEPHGNEKNTESKTARSILDCTNPDEAAASHSVVS